MSNAYGNRKPVKAAVYRDIVSGRARDMGAKKICEIGVWAGDLSKLFVERCPDAHLTIVDPWTEYGWPDGSVYHDQAKMDGIAREVRAWAAQQGGRVHVLRAASLNAVTMFPDEGFDYIHFDHDKKAGTFHEDIEAWLPKLAPGGEMSGDNYENPHIADEVRKVFPVHQLDAKGRVWWIRK